MTINFAHKTTGSIHEKNLNIHGLQRYYSLLYYSYIKDLQGEIGLLKVEISSYRERVQVEDKATDTDTDSLSDWNLNEDTVGAIIGPQSNYGAPLLQYDVSPIFDRVIAEIEHQLSESEEQSSLATDTDSEMNLKEVFQSQEYYIEQLKTLETEIVSMRERLRSSDEESTSKSKEFELLKERLKSTTNKLTFAEKQISELRQKEQITQEIIAKMKVDYEAAAEEERQKNKELNSKLQAAIASNHNSKEHGTLMCCPCLRSLCFRRLKAQYMPGATISVVPPSEDDD